MRRAPERLQRRESILRLGGAFTLGVAGNVGIASAGSPAWLSSHALERSGALAHAALVASNRIVSSCADDGGAGTLRTVVSGAIAGDTIDLTGLPGADPTCVTSTITLSAGALTLGVSLTLKGPPDALLTIAGNGTSTVVGSLQPFEIDDLTISHGRGGAKGGCIYAKGGVTLRHSNVTDCIVTGSAKYANGIAMGGGIYATSVALLDGSRVQASLAQGVKTQFSSKYPGLGGGVFAKSQFTCTDSTISGNTATFAAGGVFSYGSPTLTRCTIDSNTGGGIITVTTAGTLTVNQSTISGNSPVGIQSQSALSISNSTVAFNSTTSDRASGIYATQNVVAQSTIVASNYAVASTHADLQIGGGVVVSGADNLVMSTDASTGPGVITLSADPLLQPLADNGGPTQTHALAAQSPAIDKGNNAALYPTDQRGSGFAREVPAGSADIGAYEFRGDGIFYDGFQ